MIPQQTFESYPVFGDNATKVQPDNAKYSAGFIEGDVYPAEWVNWKWNKDSQGIVDANRGLTSMEAELNNVLTGAGKTADESQNNQLLLSIQKLISDAETRAKLAAHPVGSLYWSSASTDPGTLFGGTWTRVKDKFILAAGDTYSAGDTGGAATVTLTKDQIPAHTHTLNGHTHTLTPAGTISGGSYTFTGSSVTTAANNRGHTHKVTAAGTVAVTTNPTFTGTSHSHSFTPSGTIAVSTNPTFTGSEHSHTYTPAGSIAVKTNPTFTGTSHTHSFTPAGTIAVTTNPSFTGSEHSHSYTPAGTISITTNPTFTGTSTATTDAGAHTHYLIGFNARIANNKHWWNGYTSASSAYRIALYNGTQSPAINNQVNTSSNSNASKRIALTVNNWESTGSGTYDFRTDTALLHSHNHTPEGTISGGAYKFTGTAATLKATQGGSISGGAYTFTGTAGTTGGTTAGGSISGGAYTFTGTQATLKATAGGSISGGAYSFTGTAGTTGGKTAGGTISGGAYSFTGTEVTSGGESQNHTHTVTASGTVAVTTNPTFTGTQGTTSANSGNTSSTGGSGSHNNMPPYKVYYCWERTA